MALVVQNPVKYPVYDQTIGYGLPSTEIKSFY